MIHRSHLGLPGDAIIDYENPNNYTEGTSFTIPQEYDTYNPVQILLQWPKPPKRMAHCSWAS